jgi:hypothetical protein
VIAQGDLQSHWKRIWLRAPGVNDETTRVHWMQCGALYADLRIPVMRPSLSGAGCLADLDAPALLALMAAEGFAGTITVESGICTWARHINWHGAPDGVDAGLMSFHASGDLIEDGVHADYSELWRKMPDAPTQALRIGTDGREGVLVLSEGGFLIGLGTPEAPASAPLIAALRQGRIPVGLALHFRSVYALGRWDGAQGIAALCTDPFMEGTPVLARTADGFTFTDTTFDGQKAILPLRLLSAPQDMPQRVR